MLQHIAKEHNISEEENEKITEMQDLKEVKITKGNEMKCKKILK